MPFRRTRPARLRRVQAERRVYFSARDENTVPAGQEGFLSRSRPGTPETCLMPDRLSKLMPALDEETKDADRGEQESDRNSDIGQVEGDRPVAA